MVLGLSPPAGSSSELCQFDDIQAARQLLADLIREGKVAEYKVVGQQAVPSNAGAKDHGTSSAQMKEVLSSGNETELGLSVDATGNHIEIAMDIIANV
ncbi:hypothetical protein HPP92_012183 [Vanilla planifolia]|uniref:Uncharacterized protein n=1 Tax=Vanilla planifolia TaxID=51239 RepID=A0A835QX30_VANPL|nr:hypothetical protein HPP92_012183 [Vanilla planifolia]